MKKAIILFSGGLDSTTCLTYAKAQGYECYALSFDYGQKHAAELAAAKRVTQHFAVNQHVIMPLAIGEMGGSALTDDRLSVPDYQANGEIPITYVPARNTVFLSIALGLAEVMNADKIFIGVSAIDYSGYPDCRPEYIAAYQAMANLATKKGVEGKEIKIETPLIHLSKAETVKLGHSFGIDYRITVSCYRATLEGLACGTCDSCALRKQAFIDLGIPDETNYIAHH